MGEEVNAKVPYGALDVSARQMEDGAKCFADLWTTGLHRMRPEDITRMKKYLKRISKAQKNIRETLSSFETLTPKK